MSKKILIEAATAIVIAGSVVMAPVVASALKKAPTVCVSSVITGSGTLISSCPNVLRPGDRRGVSPTGVPL
ncbi:hypothetical protein MCEMIH16_01608 [Caulobacteraceae bacterium]